MQTGKLNILIDNSWGSCGKGNVENYLAKNYHLDICTSQNGMNSGHQFIDDAGIVRTMKMLPVAGIVAENSTIIINSGSAISVERLLQEIKEYNIDKKRLYISPTAVIIDQYCKDYEAEHLKYIASTMQGVGSALALKTMRSPKVRIARDVPELKDYIYQYIPEFIIETLKNGGTGLVEVPQGVGLSIDSQFYPMVTSRPVNVGQAIAYLDVPVSLVGDIIGLSRSYPIRVGNVKDGYSGDVYPDSKELSWEKISARIGRPVKELTTVTKRVRRVFEFSKIGFEMGVRRNGINILFLTFTDYLRPEEKEKMKKYLSEFGTKMGPDLAHIGDKTFKEIYFVNGFSEFDKNIEKVR